MDLHMLRAKIDEIDSEILRLLNERARLAQEIGKVKARQNISLQSEDREHEVITSLERKNAGPMRAADIRDIYGRIIKACRDLQIPFFTNFDDEQQRVR